MAKAWVGRKMDVIRIQRVTGRWIRAGGYLRIQQRAYSNSLTTITRLGYTS
jgi:hypothetical protein